LEGEKTKDLFNTFGSRGHLFDGKYLTFFERKTPKKQKKQKKSLLEKMRHKFIISKL
jgi:hypothetical protein